MNTSLVFGIIFAIIVIAFVLVFGAEQITNIFCVGNTAQVSKAVNDLENEVENVYNLGQGSSMPFLVKIPKDSLICLINYDDPSPMNNWNPDPDIFESINYSVRNKGQNVWIDYGCANDEGYRISHLRLSENFCVDTGTELYLENMGSYVRIERPS